MLFRSAKTDSQKWFIPQNWDWIRPLRRRIALKVLVFAAIPIICLGVFDITQMRRRAVATAEERLYQTANNARDEVSKELAHWLEATRELGADPYLAQDIAHWLEHSEDAATAEARIRWRTKNVVRYDGFEHCWFAAPDGRVLFMGELAAKSKAGASFEVAGLKSLNLAGEDFFRDARENHQHAGQQKERAMD